MNNHSFDDLIKQKASGHESPVLPGTWEAIAEKKKKRKRYPLFWWLTGIVILTAGVSVIVYQSKHKDNTEVLAVSKNTTFVDTTANNPVKMYSESGYQKEAIENEIIPLTDKNNAGEIISTPGQIERNPENVQSVVPTTTNAADLPIEKKGANSESELVIQNTRENERARNVLHPATKKSANQGIIRSNNFPSVKVKAVESQADLSDQLTTNVEIVSGSTEQPIVNYNNHSKIANLATRYLHDEQINSEAIDSIIKYGADSITQAGLAMINPVVLIPDNGSIKKNHWAVDVSITPFLAVQSGESLLYLTRINTGNMQQSNFKTDKITTRLLPSIAYSIVVHKKINARLSIGAGLQYAMVKEKVDLGGKETRSTYVEVQRLDNSGSTPQLVKDTVETINTGTLTIDALNSYRFVSIPLSLQYKLLEKSGWSLKLHGGMIINLSADYRNSIQGVVTRFDKKGIHQLGQSNPTGIDVFAGLRISRTMRAFQLFAEPMLRYNVRRYDLEGMISRKSIHHTGLSLGITYKLGR